MKLSQLKNLRPRDIVKQGNISILQEGINYDDLKKVYTFDFLNDQEDDFIKLQWRDVNSEQRQIAGIEYTLFYGWEMATAKAGLANQRQGNQDQIASLGLQIRPTEKDVTDLFKNIGYAEEAAGGYNSRRYQSIDNIVKIWQKGIKGSRWREFVKENREELEKLAITHQKNGSVRIGAEAVPPTFEEAKKFYYDALWGLFTKFFGAEPTSDENDPNSYSSRRRNIIGQQDVVRAQMDTAEKNFNKLASDLQREIRKPKSKKLVTQDPNVNPAMAFVQLAAKNFIQKAQELGKNYDVIIPAGSSEGITTILADELSKQSGIPRIDLITKSNWSFDMPGFLKQNPKIDPDKYKVVAGWTSLNEWLEKQEKRRQKGQDLKFGGLNLPAKKLLKPHLKNMYARNPDAQMYWDGEQTDYDTDIAGQTAIIVDDNVHSGSTMDDLVEIAQNELDATCDGYVILKLMTK